MKQFAFLISALFSFSISATAAFLEMPDTSELPAYERESLLLDLDVPSLKHRDPNPNAGPRLNVKEFRVQGIVEYPELGITRKSIIDKVEKIRFEMMDESKYLESGYSPEEIAQVSDLIAEIEKDTAGRHVSPVDVQKLVFLIREQRRSRGVTLGMIESVADTITQYYRERGFFLAKAYIPKQHVRDGVVTITLLLGHLGEIDVKNNNYYSSNTIRRVFNDVVHKPVSNKIIEERLYLVNDLPGLVATGYFEPGSQIGDTKLNVNVTDEKWYYANVRLDNHGSKTTGTYRIYTDFYWNNLSGLGDQLQVGVLGTFEPDNTLYGMFRYSIPIFSPRWVASIGASTNDFVTDEASTASTRFKIEAKSTVTDVNLNYKINRSRKLNQGVNFNYARITSDVEYGSIANAGIYKVVNKAELSYQLDYLNESKRTLHQGSLSIAAADMKQGAIDGLDAISYSLSLNYSHLSFIPIPFSENRARWVNRISGQYAGKALTEVLQFGLAGPTRARAYKINEHYADDGIYLGSDLIFNGPFKQDATFFGEHVNTAFQPVLFVDASYGKNYSYIEGEPDLDAYLVNAGVGIKINFKSVRGDLSVAVPIDGKRTFFDENLDDGFYSNKKPGDGTAIYFNLQYSF